MTSTVRRERYFTSLPQQYYTDPDIFRRDMDGVWLDEWLFAGHVSQLPRHGSYFTFEVGDESLIVIRDRQGEVRALHNTCRHRGFQLCETGTEGQVRRLVCPYHAWTYDTDGALAAAPAHGSGDTFDFADFSLRRAQVDVFHGFVFVSLSDRPKRPVGEGVAAPDERFLRLRPQEMKVVAKRSYTCRSNWKLLMENGMECYHCGTAHPELCRTLNLGDIQNAIYDSDTGISEPFFFSMQQLTPGSLSHSMDGRPVCRRYFGDFAESPGFDDGFEAGFAIQPAFALGMFTVDYGVVVSIVPVSPDETRLVCHWLVDGAAREGEDYDPDTLVELWDVTNKQDIALAERQQKGIRSRTYTPGPNSADQEPGIRSSLSLYLERIGEPGEPFGL